MNRPGVSTTVGRHRARAPSGGYLVSVRATAAMSMSVMGLSAVTGLVLARFLGASGRGSYAAISAYLGSAVTVGECGLSTAICFYVAHRRREAADIIRTARTMLLALGTVTAVASLLAAPLLFHRHGGGLTGFRVVAICMPMMFVLIVYVFALQATAIRQWNLVRFCQPVVYAAGIALLAALGGLTVQTAVAGLLVSSAAQWAVARRLARRAVPEAGRFRRDLVGPLFRYGFTNLAASTPYLVNTQLDQLVLAVLVPPAELGRYAVAVSVSTISYPVATAFGSVAMPRIAARDNARGSAEPEILRAAVIGSLLVGLVTAGGLCVLAPVVIPRILGEGYRPAVVLLWVLAPGSVVLGCNHVMGDILRGLNRSLAIARCEAVGAVCTGALLGALVPVLGVLGAAVASTAAYSVSFCLLARTVAAAAGTHDTTRDTRLPHPVEYC
jgi:enterobacterial common antigen flippase